MVAEVNMSEWNANCKKFIANIATENVQPFREVIQTRSTIYIILAPNSNVPSKRIPLYCVGIYFYLQHPHSFGVIVNDERCSHTRGLPRRWLPTTAYDTRLLVFDFVDRNVSCCFNSSGSLTFYLNISFFCMHWLYSSVILDSWSQTWIWTNLQHFIDLSCKCVHVI